MPDKKWEQPDLWPYLLNMQIMVAFAAAEQKEERK